MFSFKEMLKGYKKPNKATREEGEAAEEEEEEIVLGTFPQSVHKLWKLKTRYSNKSSLESPSSHNGKKIAICLTVVDSLPHEGLFNISERIHS